MRIADVVEVTITTKDGHTYTYQGHGNARQVATEIGDTIPPTSIHYISAQMSIKDGTVFTPGVGLADALPPRLSDGRPVAEDGPLLDAFGQPLLDDVR